MFTMNRPLVVFELQPVHYMRLLITMASTSSKRTCLKLSDKVKIIEEVALGAGVTQLAKRYGVSKSTICKIKRLKAHILRRTCDTFGGPANRKTLKNAKAPKMENSLYKWFLKQRENHVPISGKIIKERAKQLSKKLTETENFVASDGWLQRFKKSYGIRLLSISSEKLSAQPQLIQPAINLWNKDKQMNDVDEKDEEDDEDFPTEIRNVVTDAQAIEVFNQALDWAEVKQVSYSDILVLRELRAQALEGNAKRKFTQTKIADYFSSA